jgi:hypothetical protein
MADTKINLLQNLGIDANLKGAILDNDGGGPYRASPATPTNPLATLADVGSFIGFRADSSGFGIAVATTTINAYGTTHFNVGGGSLVAGVYTIPEDGYYEIKASWQIVSGTANSQTIFSINLTGTASSQSFSNSMTGTASEPQPGESMSIIALMTAGDTVYLSASNTATAQMDVAFSVHKIG